MNSSGGEIVPAGFEVKFMLFALAGGNPILAEEIGKKLTFWEVRQQLCLKRFVDYIPPVRNG